MDPQSEVILCWHPEDSLQDEESFFYRTSIKQSMPISETKMKPGQKSEWDELRISWILKCPSNFYKIYQISNDGSWVLKRLLYINKSLNQNYKIWMKYMLKPDPVHDALSPCRRLNCWDESNEKYESIAINYLPGTFSNNRNNE